MPISLVLIIASVVFEALCMHPTWLSFVVLMINVVLLFMIRYAGRQEGKDGNRSIL